jgi:hypothetical protein
MLAGYEEQYAVTVMYRIPAGLAFPHPAHAVHKIRPDGEDVPHLPGTIL